MVKSLTALALFLFLAAAGFAPKLEASEIAVLAKGDRLAVREAVLNCATQVWPDIPAPCLRNTGSAAKILEARLVSARR